MPRKRPTTEAEWEQKRAEDRARYHANPKKYQVYTKRWAQKNRDRINELRRKRRAEAPKHPRAKMTDEQRAESIKAAHRKYYLSKRESLRRKWASPEYREAVNLYRREKRKNDPIWRDKEAERRRAKRGHPGPKRVPMTEEEKRIKKSERAKSMGIKQRQKVICGAGSGANPIERSI